MRALLVHAVRRRNIVKRRRPAVFSIGYTVSAPPMLQDVVPAEVLSFTLEVAQQDTRLSKEQRSQRDTQLRSSTEAVGVFSDRE